MESYALILISTLSFGFGGIVLGYNLGISKGMQKRSRMQILENFPVLKLRETLN